MSHSVCIFVIQKTYLRDPNQDDWFMFCAHKILWADTSFGYSFKMSVSMISGTNSIQLTWMEFHIFSSKHWTILKISNFFLSIWWNNPAVTDLYNPQALVTAVLIGTTFNLRKSPCEKCWQWWLSGETCCSFFYNLEQHKWTFIHLLCIRLVAEFSEMVIGKLQHMKEKVSASWLHRTLGEWETMTFGELTPSQFLSSL